MRQIFVVLAVICYFVEASKANYVDSTSGDIEEIAEMVCKTTRGTKKLISRFSTITKLATYLSGLTSDHKLYQCRAEHLESINQLVHVVQTAEDKICDDEKLGLIENYHREYVSKISKHAKKQKRGTKAPQIIKHFFMQYANIVSTMCEINAINTIKNNQHSFSSYDLTELEEMKKFTDALGMSDLHKGYNGIYLFWNMVDSLDLAKNEKFSKYLYEAGDVRAGVQMKDARRIVALQAVCRYQMRPVYSKSLLPVLRLVDMGYYPSNRELSGQLNSDPSVKSLFFSAQICETILPVAFYSDSQLAENQIVALTKELASGLSQPQIEGIEKIMENMPEVKTDMSLISANDLDVSKDNLASLESINSNVVKKSKIINRMLKHLLKQTFKSFKSSLGKTKLFRKDSNHKLIPFEEKPLAETMKEIEQTDLIEGVDEDVEESRLRKRSGFWLKLFSNVGIYALALYQIILFLIKVVILTIPDYINTVCLEGYFDMSYWWKFGYDPFNPIPNGRLDH